MSPEAGGQNTTGIKFCGMTIPGDAFYAAELGASHVGVIFAESPRKVTEEIARAVFDAAGPAVRRVAVFGYEPIEAISEKANRIDADVTQLHATFGPEDMARLRQSFFGQIWQVISLAPSADRLPEFVFELAGAADAILLDARLGNWSGGTGIALPWKAIAQDVDKLASGIPVILAGGLRPENVGEAIAALKPSIVDVSSGVETAPGVKDHSLMKAFAEAVRSASIVGWSTTPTGLDSK